MNSSIAYRAVPNFDETFAPAAVDGHNIRSTDMYILSSWLKQWRLKLSEAETVSSTFHLNNREAKRELNLNISGRRLTCHRTPTYIGVKLDRTLVWCRKTHTRLVDVSPNAAIRTITVFLRPTQVDQPPVLAEIAPPALRREAATQVLGRRGCQHDHLLHDVMENSTHRTRLKSRHPLTHHAQQLVSSVPPQERVKHWNRQGGLSRGQTPPRDCTHSCPLHQTADRAWAYPGEPGSD